MASRNQRCPASRCTRSCQNWLISMRGRASGVGEDRELQIRGNVVGQPRGHRGDHVRAAGDEARWSQSSRPAGECGLPPAPWSVRARSCDGLHARWWRPLPRHGVRGETDRLASPPRASGWARRTEARHTDRPTVSDAGPRPSPSGKAPMAMSASPASSRDSNARESSGRARSRRPGATLSNWRIERGHGFRHADLGHEQRELPRRRRRMECGVRELDGRAGGEQILERLQQRRASGRRPHGVAHADQQRILKVLAQARERLADGRLGGAQDLRHLGGAAHLQQQRQDCAGGAG